MKQVPHTPPNDTAELQETAARICDRLVCAYALMQDTLRHAPSSTPLLSFPFANVTPEKLGKSALL